MNRESHESNSDTGHVSAHRVKDVLPSPEERIRRRKKRAIKDLLAKVGVSLGGLSVIGALALIFVFLFSELVPIFFSASIKHANSYPLPAAHSGLTLAYTSDRHADTTIRYSANGEIYYFAGTTGQIKEQHRLPIPDGVEIVSHGQSEARKATQLFGLSDGTVIAARVEFEETFPEEGVRIMVPTLRFLTGEEPLLLDESRLPLQVVGVQSGDGDSLALLAVNHDGEIVINFLAIQENMMTGELQILEERDTLPAPSASPITRLMIDQHFRNLLVFTADGMLHYYDTSDLYSAELVDSLQITDEGVEITAAEFLIGSISLIVGRSDGSLSQYFLRRNDDNINELRHVRDFRSHSASITAISAEYTRRSFYVGDSAGNVGIHYSTSRRSLLNKKVSDQPIETLYVTPQRHHLLLEDKGGKLHYFLLSNPHPEYSFTALWGKVWYEGRQEPEYIWQSSSGSDEFEPKFSQIPLTFGTLKAAFYAMLMSMPLAIMGAIYTAYFMTPRLRGYVKPTIEVMEALPTVILGFLAGLWLAPFFENNLPAIFSILFLMPLAMVAFAWIWTVALPDQIRLKVPNGWEVALLLPIVVATTWICVTMSPYLELWFFNGSMRQWLTDVGITYDQRNALVVGAAMGFAVIPTIFSIAEDAIFNVPRHLTQGSLALGATQWQTVTRVVLLTASPGIFSALMIGFGRAVGETMIVLMATGNSPVTNFSIFQGMRTLSANIAVELPETDVGSSHYRILFFAAIVLLILTFALNTAAEIVRQRLRKKYSSL